MLPHHQPISTDGPARTQITRLMDLDSSAQVLADFRSQVTQLLQERDKEWEASRKLVEAKQLTATLKRLIDEAHRVDLPDIVRDAITLALGSSEATSIQESARPPAQRTHRAPSDQSQYGHSVCGSISLRARRPRGQSPSLRSEEIEAFAQSHTNPFDLLLEADVASLLDLGAGDLSFATELVELYVAPLQQQTARVDSSRARSASTRIKTRWSTPSRTRKTQRPTISDRPLVSILREPGHV